MFSYLVDPERSRHVFLWLTIPMLRLLSSKAQGCKYFWKISKHCHVGIHWITLHEYSQMSTHVPGFQSFFRFLHYFVLAKLATTSIRVKWPKFLDYFLILDSHITLVSIMIIMLRVRHLNHAAIQEGGGVHLVGVKYKDWTSQGRRWYVVSLVSFRSLPLARCEWTGFVVVVAVRRSVLQVYSYAGRPASPLWVGRSVWPIFLKYLVCVMWRSVLGRGWWWWWWWWWIAL